MKYLALGDSYTIGEGVQPEESWPLILAQSFGIPQNNVTIVATTGWTAQELIDGLATVHLKPDYELCSLLIGVNNQYRGLSLDEYTKEFNTLVSKAIHFVQGQIHRIFVVSIPDWGVSPFAEGKDRTAIASQVDAFNAANKTLAAQRGVSYIDITPLSRSLTEDHYFTSDGLHPSGEAYTLWVEEITRTFSYC